MEEVIIKAKNIGITNAVSSLDSNDKVDVHILAERAHFNIENTLSDIKYFINNKSEDYVPFLEFVASRLLTMIEVGRNIQK